MTVSLLVNSQLEPFFEESTIPQGELFVCSSADLFIALERIRKNASPGKLRTELCNGTNSFQRLCRSGEIMLLPLSASALTNGAFTDPHCEDLNLDQGVFQGNAPEDSVRELNLKELNDWGWHIA